MASITVRGVPDDTRDVLAARAARAGRSLEEYLRRALIDLAARPDNRDLVLRIAERKRGTAQTLSTGRILEHRDAERG